MKKILRTYIIVVLACLFCISCKKTDQSPFFDGKPAIAISGETSQGVISDSLAFSFGTISSSITDTVIRIKVRAIGLTADHDRGYKLVINQQLSNAQPAEYEFPTNFVLPANKVETSVGLKVKRSERIKTAVARLVIEVQANDEFTPGARLEVLGQPVSGPKFTVSWTSLLAKPAVWDGFPTAALVFAFGNYSRTKHQLIIDATGFATYDDAVFMSDKWFYIYHKSREWLNAYNAAHPGAPLRDENGLVEIYDL